VLESAYSTRALRYASAVVVDGRRQFFFEVARRDGAHELRVAAGSRVGVASR
jgi:hypothetical protein